LMVSPLYLAKKFNEQFHFANGFLRDKIKL